MYENQKNVQYKPPKIFSKIKVCYINVQPNCKTALRGASKFYYSPNFITNVKIRRKRWGGRMGSDEKWIQKFDWET
jgi:hypothetical protein